jgi:ankyrin repeat protein
MKYLILSISVFFFISCSPDIETLNDAIRNGNLKKVDGIINSGFDLTKVETEVQPLELAIRTSNPQLREQLVSSVLRGGANPNQKLSNGELPITFTARLSQYAIAKELALAGALGTVEYKDKPVVFHYCDVGAWEVVYAFLETGIDQTSSTFGGSDILAESIFSRLMTPEVLKMLIEHGVFVYSDTTGTRAIEFTILSGNVDRLRLLLSGIQPITGFPEVLWDDVLWLWVTKPEKGRSSAEALLSAGYEIDSPGDFPLHQAFAYQVPEALTWFLENGADPNRMDDEGFLPEMGYLPFKLDYSQEITRRMKDVIESYR